jgi:hypothetical protein
MEGKPEKLEEAKAEAVRILEVIRTDNPDKAATNLKFLVDAGLISDDARRASIRTTVHPTNGMTTITMSLPKASWSAAS